MNGKAPLGHRYKRDVLLYTRDVQAILQIVKNNTSLSHL